MAAGKRMAQGEDNSTAAGSSRRGFLTIGFGAVSVGLAGAALGPAAAMIAYPLGHATTSGADAFVPVGGAAGFGAEPVKVDIFSDKVDAWNRVVQVKVGSAWVMEQGDQLVAFSTVCPHLGCGIDYVADKKKFLCACHNSWFTLEGGVEEGPSPRGMDTLETKVEENLVQIRYQRFKQGIEGKEPIA